MEYEQDNVVEMLREYRNQRYEETKHMTIDEKSAYDDKRYADAQERMTNLKKEINPNDYDFSWLPRCNATSSR
jgi:pyruvate/2-oxoacid:ferredoxin oxidoreductase beta subunit